MMEEISDIASVGKISQILSVYCESKHTFCDEAVSITSGLDPIQSLAKVK